MDIIPACDVPVVEVAQKDARESALHLPEISEVDLGRHYTELAKKCHGVNDGFYPLGSCTMKYNPRINEEMSNLPGFAAIHPLQPESTAQGALEVIQTLEKDLCEITGMDRLTLQPAAGAHGEFTGLLLIKAYHTASARRSSFLTAPTAPIQPAPTCAATRSSTSNPVRMAASISTSSKKSAPTRLPASC